MFGLYPMICDFWFTLYTRLHSSEPETVKNNVWADCLLAFNSSNVQMVSTIITLPAGPVAVLSVSYEDIL